jgi:multiple antibiotic resistance protein
VASIAITCLLIWLVLHSARWVSRHLGAEGLNVVARLTGFLLVCIGVQFVGSGIRSFMAGI